MTLDEYIEQEREHCVAKMSHGTSDEFMYYSGRLDTLDDIHRHAERLPCVCGCPHDEHKRALVTTQRTAKSFTQLMCDCGCSYYQEDGGE